MRRAIHDLGCVATASIFLNTKIKINQRLTGTIYNRQLSELGFLHYQNIILGCWGLAALPKVPKNYEGEVAHCRFDEGVYGT